MRRYMSSDFISGVSHEVGGLLTILKESVDLILSGQAGPVNEQQKSFLEMAKKNAEKTNKLVSRFFLLQKLVSGGIEFSMRGDDVNEAIKEIRKGMVFLAKRKGISFTVELDDSLPEAVFDRRMIKQVVYIFVNNALNFTKKGSVKLITRHKDGRVQVSVRDTGCGIKEDELSKLVSMLDESDIKGDRRKGDKGIGLMIAREIVKEHKGKIRIESKPGKGSTFHFTIPVK